MTFARVEKPMSLGKAYGIIFLLFLIGLVMVAIPVNALLIMIDQIQSQSELVVFEKGFYYLFGGGLLLIILFVWVTYSFISKKPLPKKVEKLGFVAFAVCLALIFIIPFFMHMAVEEYLEKKAYVICDAKSTQWLHVRTIVYTKTLPCDDINRN